MSHKSLFHLFILAISISQSTSVAAAAYFYPRPEAAFLRQSSSNSHSSELTSTGARLVISPENAHVRKPVKKPFVLTCKGEGDDPSLFSDLKWYDSMHREIQPTSKSQLASSLRHVASNRSHINSYTSNQISVRQEGDKLLLTFRSPDINDGGKYTCEGKFQSSLPLSASVKVSFYQDVKFENCPTSQALVQGQSDAFISCSVTASPPPIITWARDSSSLNDPRYVIENTGIRVRGPVDESDGGQYEVMARVEETGEVLLQTITVEVYVAPTIENIHHDHDAIEGQSVKLSCSAGGIPKPLISWFDWSMKNLSEVGGYIVDRESGDLTILKVRRIEDHGKFTCKAENAAGSSQETHEIQVLIKPNIVSFENITARASASAHFECRANGQPKPQLSIRRDGENTPLISGVDGVTITDSSTQDESIIFVTIDKVDRRHSDLYFCSAFNRGGRDERTGHLTVEYSPDLSRTQTTVKTWESNIINITCHADAIPNATISWLKRGIRITSSPTYTMYYENGLSNLQIKPLGQRGSNYDIYGIYRCEAENNVGKNFIDIHLEEARVPDMPGTITVHRSTPTMIEFSLIPPASDGGLPVRKYHLRYRKEHFSENKEITLPVNFGDRSVYKLDNLEPRASYIIRLAAQNDVGLGSYSSETRIVMPFESVPEKSEFILPDPLMSADSGDVTSTSPYEYLIQWKKPLENGRPIDQYRIRYYEVQRGEAGWAQMSKSREEYVREKLDNPMYRVSKLTPGVYYRFEVRAHNSIGLSEPSFLVVKTPSDMNSISLKASSLQPTASQVLTSLMVIFVVTFGRFMSLSSSCPSFSSYSY